MFKEEELKCCFGEFSYKATLSKILMMGFKSNSWLSTQEALSNNKEKYKNLKVCFRTINVFQ